MAAAAGGDGSGDGGGGGAVPADAPLAATSNSAEALLTAWGNQTTTELGDATAFAMHVKNHLMGRVLLPTDLGHTKVHRLMWFAKVYAVECDDDAALPDGDLTVVCRCTGDLLELAPGDAAAGCKHAGPPPVSGTLATAPARGIGYIMVTTSNPDVMTAAHELVLREVVCPGNYSDTMYCPCNSAELADLKPALVRFSIDKVLLAAADGTPIVFHMLATPAAGGVAGEQFIRTLAGSGVCTYSRTSISPCYLRKP